MLTIQRNGRPDSKSYSLSSLSQQEIEAEMSGLNQRITALMSLAIHACVVWQLWDSITVVAGEIVDSGKPGVHPKTEYRFLVFKFFPISSWTLGFWGENLRADIWSWGLDSCVHTWTQKHIQTHTYIWIYTSSVDSHMCYHLCHHFLNLFFQE